MQWGCNSAWLNIKAKKYWSLPASREDMDPCPSTKVVMSKEWLVWANPLCHQINWEICSIARLRCNSAKSFNSCLYFIYSEEYNYLSQNLCQIAPGIEVGLFKGPSNQERSDKMWVLEMIIFSPFRRNSNLWLFLEACHLCFNVVKWRHNVER